MMESRMENFIAGFEILGRRFESSSDLRANVEMALVNRTRLRSGCPHCALDLRATIRRGRITRLSGDVKRVINEVAKILDKKNVAWTQRVGSAIGRRRPTGELAEFLR